MTRKTPPGASNEHGTGKKALALLIGTLCGNIAATDVAVAGPTGGVVTQGQGAISTPTTTSTVIDQASNRLSIDWRSFDVASNESVRFNQPTSNAVALNRILDLKPSEVLGRIDANGRVVLFNSHGIMFGAGSQVNVGSLLATSLNVISFDESTGQLRLAAAGSPGSIINNGTITAAPGGSVSLVGGLVANNGLIAADFGSVNLAAGRTATLDFYGGGLLRFEADSALTDNPAGAAAGVSNAGNISADGGQVLLTTSAAQNVFDRAINNDGLVSAARIENVGGSIRLVGAGGTVVNSGVLDASGGAGSTGGSVQVLGENVGLFGHGRIDVSGDRGGGTALLGGDYQGGNPDVLNASRTIVGPDAQILADAGTSGDGGRVILWSDNDTRFYGSISGRGGAASGNGGFTEVSSHGALDFGGLVNLGAPAGSGGTLLLDPTDIIINATGPQAPNLDFTDGPATATVGADDIEAALRNTAAVFLHAEDDIQVNAPIDVSGAGNALAENKPLTLLAGDDIDIDADITLRNGTLTIRAHDSGGTDDAGSTGDLRFGGGALNTGTGAIVLSGEGDIALGSLTGGAITVTSTAGSITNPGENITGTSLTVTAATSINLDTTVGSLSASAATPLTIDNTGALVVTNAAGDDIDISTSGNLTLGMVNAAGTATLTSLNGAILDDGAATAVAGDDIDLDAETGIGQVTLNDLLNGTSGTPLQVNTAGNLTATVASVSGQINLDLVQIPDIAAGGIDLGGAGVATGTILLQTAGDFDLVTGTPLLAGAINLGASNSARVGFRSGGILTLPANANTLFDNTPGTLAVDGTNVLDDNGAGLNFNVGSLIFRSGTAATLTTDIDQLNATMANNQNLFVDENDALQLGQVSAGTGTVTLDVNGVLFDGAGATPSVVAGQLTILDANGVDLDTNLTNLDASGVNNALTVREQNGALNVIDASTTGGSINISTVNGALTVATATGTGVTLNAGNAVNGVLTVNGTVNAGAGSANFTAGNSMGLGTSTVNAASATLTSNGAMTLGVLNAAGGTVSLTSGGGAITDGAGVSVTANQLNISSSASADLNTNVNNLDAIVNAGNLVISEANGLLTVSDAAGSNVSITSNGAGGALTVTGTVNAGNGLTTLTTNGAMTLTGSTVNTGAASLTSNGDMQLGTINALIGAGTVALQAGVLGDITDGAGVSVNADSLTISNSASANLNTNVDNLTAAVGVGGLTISEASGLLTVANASSAGGAVSVSTVGGPLTVANASGTNVTLAANGGGVLTVTGTVGAGAGVTTLTAGGAMTLTGSTVNTGSAALTSNGAMALGTLNSAGGTVSLAAGAGGAITDGAGVSVTANQLTVTSALDVDLNTDVNSLTASGVGNGGITINESTGPLAVTGATSIGGAVAITAATGSLTVNNVTGTGVTLNAGSTGTSGDSVVTGDLTVTGTVNPGSGTASLTADGAITLGTVNAGTTGSVTLAARDGAITDTVGAVPSVVASTLTITDADSVDLDTNVTTLDATGVTTSLAVRDQVGGLVVTNAVAGNGVSLTVNGAGGNLRLGNVNAGTGAATLTATAGTIDDDDVTNPAETTTVSGASVTLTALDSIGTVTNFVAAEGSSIDVNTSGALIASVTTPTTVADTAINLNVTGAPIIGIGDIALGSGAGRSGRVLLQSPNDLNLAGLTGGAIDIGAANNVSVGYVSGGLLTLPTSGSPTDTAPANLLVSGDDIVAAGGTPRTIGLSANTAVFNSANPGGAYTLETSVGTLHANVNNVGLTINENLGDITLGGITASTLVVNANTAGGAILDDGIDGTIIDADSVTLDTTGAIGGAGVAALDVDTASLTASTDAGDVSVNSVGAGLQIASITAGTGGTNNVSLSGNAAITDAAGPAASIVANQLTITNAASANLDTDVNTLNASGVTGALTVREQAGALAVTNAASTGGAVNVSTVAGAMTVTAAAGNGVTLTAGGAGNGLTLGTVNAGAGTATLAAGGAITDGAGVSVTANQLTITAATTADLNTNVNSLNATGVSGDLTISEASGPLTVTNAVSTGGAVNVSTVAGALNNVNAAGTNVTLTAGGGGNAITLASVNAGAGTVTLDTTGAISDAAGAAPSVIANQLIIGNGVGTVDLDTNVNTLTANFVAGALSVREQAGPLTVTNVAASGAANVSTVAGALTVTSVTGNGVTLSAGGAGTALTIGTVNAGPAGTATLAAGGAITDAAGATPSVVAGTLAITSAGSADLDTNVNTLNASGVTGALSVREQTGSLTVTNASAAGAVDVSTVDGALTNVNAAGSAVTLTAGGAANSITLGTVNAGSGTATLNAGGAISDAAGATPSVVANQLTIAGPASVNLDTDINTLNATGVVGNLTVREQTGALAVANATSTGGAVNLSTVAGSLTNVNASGTNVTLTAGGLGSGISLGTVSANPTTGTVSLNADGAVTDATGATASVVANQLDVVSAGSVDLDTDINSLNAVLVRGALAVREQTGALTVVDASATGAVNVSTAAGALTVTSASGNGVSLTAGGAGNALTLGAVNAGTGTATLAAGGAITDAAGATPSVVAGTLAITGAASADLDTDVNALNATGVAGALSIREQTGALTVTNAVSTGGAVTVSTVAGALTNVSAAGTNVTLTAGGGGNAISLASVNAGAGTATLNATGAITDAAGSAASVVANQLTISSGAASVDLDTNVNTLTASGVTGALAVREQAGPLTVTNATAVGAVNLSTVAGALTATAVTGNGVTLSAGGAGNGLTLGTVTAGTGGTATLAAGGAITDGAGATPSVVADTLAISSAGSADLDTNVNTLNASGVTGALAVREQTGNLAVTNANAGGAVNVSTVNGNLTVTNAASSGGALTLTAGGAGSTLNLTNGSGASANLTSGGNMVIASNTLNVGTGAATLTAGGSLTDGTTGTALRAGAATLNAASIGTAANTFDVSVNSLSATTTTGGMFINEADNITLTNLTAQAASQDVVVGALGNITVAQISNANGRVLLAGNRDILSTGNATHITAQSVELRAGRDTTGGRIGTAGQPLRISGPPTVPGGANGTGDPVPNILVLQNQSAAGSQEAAQTEQLDLDADSINISRATFDPSAAALPASAFLTTTFSTRTASGADRVTVANAPFDINGALNGDAQVGLSTRGAGALLSASGASNAQGEGTLVIDWASFDPNVSLFGTVNPPICLPADQSDEDSGDASATTSSGCASTTAQYDGSFRMPEVKLVITSRGVEWVTVPSGNVTVFPLIGQIR